MTTPSKDVEAGLRHRPPHARTHHEQAPPIASRAFAGRIGGNQEFTVSPADSDFTSIVAKTPDATPLFTWRSSFTLSVFASPDLWKEATIEGVGTCLQVYLAGLYAVGLSSQADISTVTAVAVGSVANVFLISLFIFGGGPVSGGHFNPLITMATFAARLAAFPRAVLYVVFQCGGAVVAGFVLRASLGGRQEVGVVPGCTVDTAVVTAGEA